MWHDAGINRYIMECKFYQGQPEKSYAAGINRYIMECKFSDLKANFKWITGINRYIMECKFTLEDTFGSDFNELIDTLWNVNEKI